MFESPTRTCPTISEKQRDYNHLNREASACANHLRQGFGGQEATEVKRLQLWCQGLVEIRLAEESLLIALVFDLVDKDALGPSEDHWPVALPRHRHASL